MPEDSKDCECTFVRRGTDEDVSKLSDAELGAKVRAIAEEGNGAWVFQTTGDKAVRVFREIERG